MNSWFKSFAPGIMAALIAAVLTAVITLFVADLEFKRNTISEIAGLRSSLQRTINAQEITSLELIKALNRIARLEGIVEEKRFQTNQQL